MEADTTHVLVVHRNPQLAKRLRDQLASSASLNLSFSDGSADAALRLPAALPDIILLDLTVPVPPGFELYRLIHPRSPGLPPVLILRVRQKRPSSCGVRERRYVDGAGIETIETCLHMALGRTPHAFAWLPTRFTGRHLVADLPNSYVAVDGRATLLSVRESELLALLLANVNRLVQREVMISKIWGFETRSLDVHIRRLRHKLGSAGQQIETVVGFGYRFVEPGLTATSLDARPSNGETDLNEGQEAVFVTGSA